MKSRNKLLQLSIIFIAIIGGYFVNDNSFNKEKVVKTTFNDVSSNLNIYYFDVGQADSILIQNNNKNMLIDCGNDDDGDNIVKYLKNLNVSRIDALVGTHPHEDHIGGMDEVINSFDIGSVYMPDVVTTTRSFENVIDALENKNLSITVPKIDSSFNLEDMKFEVLYVGDDSEDLNNTSIVLKLIFGKTSYLFMGDATLKVEKSILDKDLKSDVLKVGHHGSNYSTSMEFLNKVNPKYAIISVGRDNVYNHPSDLTINKLSNKNIAVFRTDKDNTIKVTSDGNDINIKKLNVVLDG